MRFLGQMGPMWLTCPQKRLILIHRLSAHLNLQLAAFDYIGEGDVRVGKLLAVQAVLLHVYLIILGHSLQGFVGLDCKILS